MSDNAHWMQRDLAVLWHPCTQMKDHETLPVIPVSRGEGVWLHDFEGNRYLDAVSSWWVNIFGHAHPFINERIKEQLDRLEHVILAGFSHQPVIELSERLVDITPEGLNRVFYADNGSSGVEVALKMSFHYWLNRGRPEKTRFITLANSYHGETLGALAVGDTGLYKDTYRPLLLEALTAPSADCRQAAPGEDCSAVTARALAGMRALLERHAHESCAVIVEPLVQCASGMRMHSPEYLAGLRRLCDEFEVHLIADEIAVGFGRTGTLFACEQAGISPDFLCLSKGLTAGYLPLAAVLTHERVYQAFYDDYERLTAFLHSHSYTGNPLACAAALATLDLFESEGVIERNRQTAEKMDALLEPFKDHPHVRHVRRRGMIAALDLVDERGEPYPWQERRGLRGYQAAMNLGVMLRPLGNTLYWMPPYVINDEELALLGRATEAAIAAACA
ncbi:MAG: adenosylmethionine--8-amino-7-oxononanoate transaminase [Halothiobacillaceae bacterium]